MQNFQPLANFSACKARFVSNLFRNNIVGFLMTRLTCTLCNKDYREKSKNITTRQLSVSQPMYTCTTDKKRKFTKCSIITLCVPGSPMVPLVGNIFTICTNLITNGTTGKEIGANGKNGNANGTIDTNVTN